MLAFADTGRSGSVRSDQCLVAVCSSQRFSVGIRARFPKEGGTGRRAGRQIGIGTIVSAGQTRGTCNRIRLADVDVDRAGGAGGTGRHRRLAGQRVVRARGTRGARRVVAQAEIRAERTGVALDGQD